MDKFINTVNNLNTGNPAEEATDVGPMIHPDEVDRVKNWLADAVQTGANILTGGINEGNLFYPTVVTDVDPRQKISCKEVFAPLVVIYKYKEKLH